MRDNKGAIAIFTLLAMLFFLIFVMVVYNNVSTKSKTQVESTKILVKTYKSETDTSSILNQKLAGRLNGSNDSVVKTEKQREALEERNGSYIVIDGRIYSIN